MEHEHRITPLELFFDLVFVFAFTQVTQVISADTTWTGMDPPFFVGRSRGPVPVFGRAKPTYPDAHQIVAERTTGAT